MVSTSLLWRNVHEKCLRSGSCTVRLVWFDLYYQSTAGIYCPYFRWLQISFFDLCTTKNTSSTKTKGSCIQENWTMPYTFKDKLWCQWRLCCSTADKVLLSSFKCQLCRVPKAVYYHAPCVRSLCIRLRHWLTNTVYGNADENQPVHLSRWKQGIIV